MRRVKILVEGQTEESFVNKVLAKHLAMKNVFITPILLTTKRVKNRNRHERNLPGRRFKGGISTYSKVKFDVQQVLNDKQAIVTTMIDFYGLPTNFPGMDTLPSGNGYEKARYLQKAFKKDVGSSRFFPFLTLHEYEALLFSKPQKIADAFPEQAIETSLFTIRNQFSSPEEIDQGIDTHPSARITSIVSEYRKPLHGTLIAERIGLDDICHECPHFSRWVKWLESLER